MKLHRGAYTDHSFEIRTRVRARSPGVLKRLLHGQYYRALIVAVLDNIRPIIDTPYYIGEMLLGKYYRLSEISMRRLGSVLRTISYRETNSCGGCMIRGGGGGDSRRSTSVSENAELPLAVTRGPILS